MKKSTMRKVIEERYYASKDVYNELMSNTNEDNYLIHKPSLIMLINECRTLASLYYELFNDEKLMDDHYPKYRPYKAP